VGSSAEPNEFQSQLLAQARDELARRKIPCRVREEMLGNEFTYVVSWCGIELWVYIDGCNIVRGPIDDRFETYDYDSMSDLKEAAIRRMRSIVERDQLGACE
jgi:hypothetical protein